MKLVICTKFQVIRMNCVESTRGGGKAMDLPPPTKALCNYFFFEASRVNGDVTNCKIPHILDILPMISY